ncbi:hypothetical protein ACHAXN_010032 [Cyclotella atomus]
MNIMNMEDTDRTIYDADVLTNSTKGGSNQDDFIENSVLVTDLSSHHEPVAQVLPKVLDHYSLISSSSAIKFKTAHVNIYDQGIGRQFILEERVTLKKRKDHVDSENGDSIHSSERAQAYITVKSASHATPGLVFVRLFYSSIALFLPGFFFIMGVGLILFLFAHLAEGMGHTLGLKFFGTLFSLPILLDGMTHIMVLATMFVVDIFRGSPLILSFGWGAVLTSWILFVVFVGAPFLVCIGSLLSGSERVLELSMVTSFLSVGMLFVVFEINIAYFRFTSCIHLIQHLSTKQPTTLRARITSTVINASRFYLSGVLHSLYAYESNCYDIKKLRLCPSAHGYDAPHQYRSHGGGYIKLTKLPVLRLFFETLDPPQRIWTQSERDGGNLPFFTTDTWSLEHFLCRSRTQSAVVMMGGPSAVNRRQLLSSAICDLLYISCLFLAVLTALLCFQAPTAATVGISLLVLVWFVPHIINELGFLKKTQLLADEYKFNDKEDVACIFKWEASVHTRPTVPFTMICLASFTVLFVIFPTIYIFISGNTIGGIMFVLLYFVHITKTCFDPSPITAQLGSYTSLGRNNSISSHDGILGATSLTEWKQKSRLFHADSMSTGLLSKVWSKCFIAFTCLFAVVALGATLSDAKTAAVQNVDVDSIDPIISFPSNATYYYNEPEPGQPTCRLDHNRHRMIKDEETFPILYLSDYILLSSIAYYREDAIQPLLDEWFGASEALLVKNAMADFRTMNPEFSKSSASYELVEFANASVAVLTVRGTANNVDLFADAKIWYSSALFQVYRWFIPFGHFFNPLIEFCIRILSFIESAGIGSVAYYLETTKFVNDLKQSKKYNHVKITGHSLGGGIAMITGAQTSTEAVGLSAPNTVLARTTVNPPVTLDQLEKYTHNIAPERGKLSVK